MSRGRRRRGRKGPSRPDQSGAAPSQGQPASQPGPRPGGRRRRRRGGGGGEHFGLATAVKEMSFRRSSLETLPDDGLVLDELISDLKTEYGVPATPQEYRLFIKIPTADEAAEKVAEAVKVDPPDEEANVEGERPKNRRRRRGRRRRRPGSSEAQSSETPAGEAPAFHEEQDPPGGTIL